MNDPMEKLEALAEKARREDAPSVNVSGRVAMAVARAEPIEDEGPLNWLAFASIAAAAVAVLALTPLYSEVSNPMVAALIEISWGVL